MKDNLRPTAIGAVVGLILSSFLSTSANAQDPFGSLSAVRVGGAVGFQPKYEGSDEYRAFGFPLIIPQFGSGPSLFSRYVAIRGLDDVRFKVLKFSGLEAGPLAGYTFGRDQDDADRLLGLGDVDDGAIVGAFVSYRWDVFLLDVSYHHQVSGDVDGYQLRFGAGIEQPVNEQLVVTGRVGATFADDNFQEAYFGVSDTQAATSVAGLNAFEADSGIKDVHVEFGARLKFADAWTLNPQVRYSRLVGDAADSPVIETEDQFSGRLGVTYRFPLR